VAINMAVCPLSQFCDHRKGVIKMDRISINPRLEVTEELNVLTCQVKTHADYLLDPSKTAELQDWLEMKGHLFTPGSELGM